jgi:hypothetical protein
MAKYCEFCEGVEGSGFKVCIVIPVRPQMFPLLAPDCSTLLSPNNCFRAQFQAPELVSGKCHGKNLMFGHEKSILLCGGEISASVFSSLIPAKHRILSG